MTQIYSFTPQFCLFTPKIFSLIPIVDKISYGAFMDTPNKQQTTSLVILNVILSTIAAGFAGVAVQYFLFGSVSKGVTFGMAFVAGVGTYFFRQKPIVSVSRKGDDT